MPYPFGTFTVRTPSGGTHLYFTATGTPVPNSAGTLGRHIDIRAAGGYVVAPGSRIAGRAYQAHDATAGPSPLPAWIPAALAGQRAEPQVPSGAACVPQAAPVGQAGAYAMGDRGRSRHWIDTGSRAPPGTRQSRIHAD